MMRFAIVVFPGSNCDHDCYYCITHVLNQQAEFVWHKSHLPEAIDCVILPGGFSYGDYLRCGSMARFSPVMKDVVRFAKRGGLVIGICNGFQILLESELLPGALIKNKSLQFICKNIYVKIEHNDFRFTEKCKPNDVLKMPIAHGEGCYYASPNDVKKVEDQGLVVMRYCDREGVVNEVSNPNGSLHNIAGISNHSKNVFGLMPHPERACESILGKMDGLKIFHSILGNRP